MAEKTAVKRRSLWARVRRILAWVVGLLVVVVGGGGFWLYRQVSASLPRLDGEVRVNGLTAAVEIARDELGVPTVRAANRSDAARALGFLHGQERFFQMDLLRRQAAGELAELFGAALLPTDRSHRLHRLRSVAQRVIAAAPPEEKTIVEAYAAGVNAGLAALASKPFEYFAARSDPTPWRPEDSVLVAFAMFFELQDETGEEERELTQLAARLPAPMFDFLTAQGTEWDAPLFGEPLPVPPIPGPEVYELRRLASTAPHPEPAAPPIREPAGTYTPGSNNWAVAGSHTADGRALVANDMHLGIRVPNTWYRAVQIFNDERGESRRLAGVTLPGTPAMVAGSNGHIAWGFTNSYGDWTDLVELELDPTDSELYATPQGPARITRHTETLRVRGAAPASMEIRATIWGPLLPGSSTEKPRAIAWTAHDPRAVNFGLLGLETVTTVGEAVAQAHRCGIPAQNFVVADETGRIAWTIIGAIPRRIGFSGRLPASWADGSRGWQGWLGPEEVPKLIDPPGGRIWTANNRTTGGEMLAKLGDGGFDLGARAQQIRDGLLAIDKATPRDLLAVQLDDRALFLTRWHDLLLKTLSDEAVAGNQARGGLRELLRTTWTGRASTDSVAYRLTRAWRAFLAERVWLDLTRQQEVLEDERFGFTQQFEGPLWRLVSERPAHLLDPSFENWDQLLLQMVDETLGFFSQQGSRLADRSWGERNSIGPQHPLSLAVPLLGGWLDVPAQPLSGDDNMPRVITPDYGASERFVVAPGHEEDGIFHMPVGQSGHPLSPYYKNGHQAWAEGQSTPFLPGSSRYRLTLVPQ